MPLPNLLKNIIGKNGNHHNTNSPSKYCAGPPASKGSSQMSPNMSPKPRLHLSAPQHKPKSLSQINGLHSHRNLKISHQLQLAESMYDPSIKSSLRSKLSYNFEESLSDDGSLPYFLQYIESLEKSAKNVISCFLQANCLMTFLKQNFECLNFELLGQLNPVLNEKQNENFALFLEDFMRLYNHFTLLNCDDTSFQIKDELRNQLNIYFNNLEENNFQTKSYSQSLQLFFNFWKSLYNQIETKYYESFLRSNLYLKYEIDILKSANLELSDILHSSTEIASTFLDFMNSEDMKNFVDFLIMHKNYKSYSRQHSDALALYDRFFNSANKSSSTFLDFSDQILQELKQSIREEYFNPECFDKIAYILIQYFAKTYLPQFLQSDSFAEYMNTCQVKLIEKNHKLSSAKLTSSVKVDDINKRDISESSHSSEHLPTDSESLWKRDLKGQLQFTYIDNYGRMNSLFEPEPDKTDSSSGKLTKVIKRFTSNSVEEKKKEEDDAWRIAESIINDVCSVTIDHSDLNSLDSL